MFGEDEMPESAPAKIHEINSFLGLPQYDAGMLDASYVSARPGVAPFRLARKVSLESGSALNVSEFSVMMSLGAGRRRFRFWPMRLEYVITKRTHRYFRNRAIVHENRENKPILCSIYKGFLGSEIRLRGS